MKIKLFFTFLLVAFTTTLSFAQAKKEIIKVWGNCGMCQQRIEGAAKKAGATSANWDSDNLQLVVVYDANETNNTKIQKAIAKVGYDTQDFTGDNKAYSKLHGCCKYERKQLEISPKTKG
jgi:hypothetical protein